MQHSGKIKVGVVGVGSMGINHVRVYSGLEGVELVAVCDTDLTLKKISREYKCRYYDDCMELIKNEKLDCVSIATPTSTHEKIAAEFLKRGIACLIEKPISNTIKGAENIIETAEKSSSILMLGHIERFNPAVMELKERLDKGELGRIFKIDVKRVGPFTKERIDTGVVMDLATHDLDIISYLTNSEIEKIHVEALKNICTEQEDSASMILRLKNKVLCSLNIDWVTPVKKRELHLTGEKGMFYLDYISQNLVFYGNETSTQIRIKKEEPLKTELKHFIECVKNKKKPITSGKQGLEAVKSAIKIIERLDKNGS